jgi:hypothetical protein
MTSLGRQVAILVFALGAAFFAPACDDDDGAAVGSGDARGSSTSVDGSAGQGGSAGMGGSGGSVGMGGSGGGVGGSMGGADAGTPSNVPLERMPTELARALCEKMYACCSPAQLMNNLFAGSNQQSCQTNLATLLTLAVPSIQESLTRGRATYHGDKLGTCLMKLRAQDCAQARMSNLEESAVPECEQFLEPKVALGGDCSDSGDCINSYCEGAIDAQLGKCAPKKQDGQTCEGDDQCASGSCGDAELCVAPMPGADELCE